jgi:hypothetical protein
MTNLVKGTGVSVEGLDVTLKAMRELGANNKTLSEPGYQASLILIRAALPLVPVRTGALKSTVRPKRTVRGASVQAGSPSVPYANPIHWGWAVVGSNTKSKKLKVGTYRGIKPQPFFADALGYTQDEILGNYERLMKEAIDNLPGAKK